jgi:hypothetical protein
MSLRYKLTIGQIFLYMSVLMRGILISTLNANNTSIYERAYERDSHKHANTSIQECAYERHVPKNQFQYTLPKSEL